MPFASVFGSFAGGPFHGLAFDGLTFDLGIVTDAGITVGGVEIHDRVRKAGLTIHDVLNDAPNTCSLVVEGTAPVVGQALRITINDGRVLFAGQVQSVDQSYKVNPLKPAWAVTAIDDTARANYRRPFGTFVDVSASTVAQTITATYAPGFSAAGIVAGLPPVRIVFDGADTFIACLTRLAGAIGGYCKVEDGVVYLFQEDLSAPPDPIDDDHCFMFDPPIKATVDSSQLRTRVYGKGYGESITADLLATETLIPIEDGVQFSPTGGRAIASLTPDGAQSEQLAYTGVALQVGGTVVGAGVTPTTPPTLSPAAGTGVESGVHDYAIVFATAAGKSLAGPRSTITVGSVPPPTTALTAGTPRVGPGNLAPVGTHRYYVQFKTATGHTEPGPVSNTVTVGQQAGPTTIGVALTLGQGVSDVAPNAAYAWKYTFRRLSDNAETTASPASNTVVTNAAKSSCQVELAGCQTAPAGYTRQWYRTQANGGQFKRLPPWENAGDFHGESPPYMQDGNGDNTLTTDEPGTNQTAGGSIPIANIPVSANPIVTHVDLYREFNNGGAATARFLTSQPNGTTAIDDGLPAESLGGLMPLTNTTVSNRVNITWPAGPSGVTNIEIYRTPLGSAQLKKVFTASSGAAGTTVDSTPDASLTTDAPTADTSGLTQGTGQVNPGAVALPVASAAPFRSAGGWAELAGDQVVRYTGLSGNSLTGIPASGAGAITTTVVFGSPARPAPMLLGVTGLTVAIRKGAPIHIWVQRDDLAAQAEHAARTGGDGIVEYLLADTRRGVTSLTARCDAELALFARPIVSVAYDTRDLKTKSGKDVLINLTSPPIHVTLTIQDVTITEIDQVPGVPPRYTVQASSVRFSLEDTLRRLIAGGQIVGGSS